MDSAYTAAEGDDILFASLKVLILRILLCNILDRNKQINATFVNRIELWG